jgi:hypothetical protein
VSLLLGSSKHRRKLINELAHFKWLDERYVYLIPAKTAHDITSLAPPIRTTCARTVAINMNALQINARFARCEKLFSVFYAVSSWQFLAKLSSTDLARKVRR